MRKLMLKKVATYLIAIGIVSALTFLQPIIGTVHATEQESSIHGNATSFVTQYKELQELGKMNKVVTVSSQGTKQVEITYQDQSGKLSGAVNADGSLRTMTYQAEDFPYFSQLMLDQEVDVQGDSGVTVARTLHLFVNIFSPTANAVAKENVYHLFDSTPRLSPGKAIWRSAAIGNIRYSLHVTKDGLCTIKVWNQSYIIGSAPSPELRLVNEPTRYVLHYGAKEYANTYPEHYDTAQLIGIMNGLNDQDKVAIIQFNNGTSDLHPLYRVLSIESGTLVSLYDSTLAAEAKVNAMSEDKSKFVFGRLVENNHTLYVADLKKRKFARYDLPKKDLTNAIMNVEWIDSNTIGVDGHINPYINSYYMLNISSGIWSEPLHGLFFSWTPKDLFYAESFPNSKGGKSIKSADGTTIYSISTEDSSSIVKGLWFDELGDRVVFFEQKDDNNKITLVVATLDGTKPLHIDKRIPYQGATGAVKWTGENQIEITQDGSPLRVIIEL